MMVAVVIPPNLWLRSAKARGSIDPARGRGGHLVVGDGDGGWLARARALRGIIGADGFRRPFAKGLARISSAHGWSPL